MHAPEIGGSGCKQGKGTALSNIELELPRLVAASNYRSAAQLHTTSLHPRALAEASWRAHFLLPAAMKVKHNALMRVSLLPSPGFGVGVCLEDNALKAPLLQGLPRAGEGRGELQAPRAGWEAGAARARGGDKLLPTRNLFCSAAGFRRQLPIPAFPFALPARRSSQGVPWGTGLEVRTERKRVQAPLLCWGEVVLGLVVSSRRGSLDGANGH